MGQLLAGATPPVAIVNILVYYLVISTALCASAIVSGVEFFHVKPCIKYNIKSIFENIKYSGACCSKITQYITIQSNVSNCCFYLPCFRDHVLATRASASAVIFYNNRRPQTRRRCSLLPQRYLFKSFI